jgi:glycosyltransferase involved in cell wall biosynthesis
MPKPAWSSHSNSDDEIGVIALVPDQWRTDMTTTRHHVMSRLAKRCPSVWLEPQVYWNDYIRNPRLIAVRRKYEVTSGLTVWPSSVLSPGFSRPAFLAAYLDRHRFLAARRYLLRRGAKKIIMYVWRPDFARFVDNAQYDACVYHIDDEYSFSEVEVATSEIEARLIQRSDAVIVHSEALLEKKRPHNAQMVVISNGVDFKAFSTPQKEPEDMRVIPKPRIGYVGMIKRQMNLELLLEVAQKRPAWSFVFVGPAVYLGHSAAALDRLKELPNCYFLGARDVQALPAYMQSLDVCLLTYLMNDYTKYINPLKIYEYLAAGRPIVGSPIRAVVAHGETVLTASDSGGLVSHIEASLLSTDDENAARERRRVYASQYDWDVIVDKILNVMRSALSNPQSKLSSATAAQK